MKSPRFLPRELVEPRQLVFLAACSAAKAIGLMLIALSLGQWISDLSVSLVPEPRLLVLAVSGAAARTLGVWGSNTAARRIGLGSKERMRGNLIRTEAQRSTIIPGDSPRPSAPVIATLASHGIEKLDDYFTKFIPALMTAMTVPLMLGLYILSIDWLSALVLIITVPLVPLFMALIGMHTQETLKTSQSKLDALAHQLYELAQGLPALLGLGRARRHGNAIAKVGEEYRRATMANLKTVFLSSFWLELISTLSVAVLAVMIGVRLVDGDMQLAAGLTILILAPELFSALREVGSAYHAADDGLAAYQQYQKLTGQAKASALRVQQPVSAGSLLEIRNLNFGYQLNQKVHEKLNLTLRSDEVHLLNTVSGSGKSSLLHLIAETASSDNNFDDSLVSGALYIGTGIAVVNQHPKFNRDTGLEQLRQDAPRADDQLRLQLAGELNLLEMLAAPIAHYSPGELRRLEVLRALLRMHSDPNCRLLLADEPTAHLDAVNAEAVRVLLEQLPAGSAALIASHDPRLTLNYQDSSSAVQTILPPAPTAAATQQASTTEQSRRPATGENTTRFNPLRELLAMSSSRKAIIYGTLSVASAVALAGLSGWLIVESSYQPAILTLTVAFVMVRTLGISRAAMRYLEQLAIHDAVLGYAAVLREKIWNSMVSRPAQWGLMSRSSVVLRFLLAEVDELRDLMARVLFPPIQAALVYFFATVVLWMIQPEFGIAAAAMGLLLAFPARWLVAKVEGTQLANALEHRLNINVKILGILLNSSSLRAYSSLDEQLEDLRRSEEANTRAARRHAVGQALAPALAALSSTLLAIFMAMLSHSPASLTALAVLLALALGESASAALTSVQQSAALSHLVATLAGHGVANEESPEKSPTSKAYKDGEERRIHGYELRDLTLSYDAGKPIVQGLSGRIEPGRWTSVTGPSGSGKSTLLTALLSALPLEGGSLEALDANGNSFPLAQGDATSVAWCPQEAHLFDSTLRRNLLLGAADEAVVTDRQLEKVLHTVGLGAWYEDQEQALETKIGSGGHQLSGGQRCKLAVARALIGGHQVILLDEPTAHLGQDEAVELIDTLQQALQGRTVVLISHDSSLSNRCQQQLVLGSELQLI